MGGFMQQAPNLVCSKYLIYMCLLIYACTSLKCASSNSICKKKSCRTQRSAHIGQWPSSYRQREPSGLNVRPQRIGRVFMRSMISGEDLAASRHNKMNEMFNLSEFEDKLQMSSGDTEKISMATALGNSTILSLFGSDKTLDNNSASTVGQNLDAYDSISLASVTDHLDNTIIDEPEMMKNNHHLHIQQQPTYPTAHMVDTNHGLATTSLGSNAQNSRYYISGNYKPSYTSNSNHIHPSHYSHGPINQHSVGKFVYNNQQSYHVHSSLSMKPSSSQQHPNYHTNNNYLVSPYISASSALSATMNSAQQTNLHKQQDFITSTTTSSPSSLENSIDIDGLSLASGAASSSNRDRPQKLSTNYDFLFSEYCGRQQVATNFIREPRIVGGNSTYEGEFPWAVSIQRHGNHHCGGVIVDRSWILTAAHCVRSQLVSNLVVRTGGYALQRSSQSIGHSDYLVDQIVMHDDFNKLDNLQPPASSQATNNHGNMMKSAANTANNADIALLRLRREIILNEFAWPVCFPSRDAGNFSGHDAIVIGWGKLSEKSEEFSNELQKVKLTIIDNKVCQNWFRQAGRDMPIDDRIICAGFKQGGKDACHGDSGGPLLSKMSNGQYIVVGVVSTGIGCARPLLPGLYSRVSSYIGWIERHIMATHGA